MVTAGLERPRRAKTTLSGPQVAEHGAAYVGQHVKVDHPLVAGEDAWRGLDLSGGQPAAQLEPGARELRMSAGSMILPFGAESGGSVPHHGTDLA
ncbi:MAG: hypothetical protein IIC71_06040 [Acidobacteria bacterium]|nr:hypothetical protein [Acidobacteriota bacterium]